jgi:murein DD-endopeptidase MepM/ murein hydrolase activator NlpD
MPRRRHSTTAYPRRPIGLAFALVLGAALVSVPAHASTESELDAARDRLEGARTELRRVTEAWQETEARLARAQDAASEAREEIERLEGELASIQQSLNDRVAAAYMSGGSFSMGALLTSDSFQDATDRLQYTLSVVQGDADLATEVGVKAEELRREEDRFREAARREAAASADLDDQRDQLSAWVTELNDVVADLLAELEAQEEALLGLGSVVLGSGAIQTCPVAGNTSFVDSFGWPRPGGRTHQGIDLIAAAGTPVVAVAPGSARTASSVLGGSGVVVQHGNGDWTFYAHLSSYGKLGAVSTGTVIGYVGSTGTTTVNHLHFEYHPNGGAAVNPYAMLLAVC